MDKKKALEYYALAAMQENAQAQFNCGAMFHQGNGIERDDGEAQKCWELAAAQGHQGAQECLAIIQGAKHDDQGT